ncbi:hypothetical protein GJ496_004422 [Pomphorhynchus laevis]|nr:hypothetical protein GJ496_004422 [Pomphorhynchus laevis]
MLLFSCRVFIWSVFRCVLLPPLVSDVIRYAVYTIFYRYISIVERRVEIFENSYFFSTLGDKNSNPFSLGIALRLPYGEYEVFAKGVNINIIKKAIDFVSWPQLFFSNWVYCNSTIEYKYDNPREPVLFYLKEKLNDSSQNSCANDSNEQLINHLIVDLYVMSQFDENLIKHRSKQKPTKVDDDFIGDISFIATSSGVSAYWCQSVCSLEQNKTARHFFSQNPITIESVYYQRTVNFTYQKLKLANSSNPEDLDKLFLFSFHYVPYTDGENSTKILHKRFAIATTTIWLKENNELRVPIAVTGTIMEQNEVFHTEFINKLTDICDTEKKLFCYILDEHGYVFAQPESKNDTVGKFFGEVNALIMNDMIQRQIYDNVTVFDFQSVCLTNKTKSSNRSSSSLAHHRFETSYMLCFTIFRVFLSMLIMMIRKSIAEAGMSLTKFLPTHFDFQAPQMNMEDGPSQPSFLEACIEIEHLFTTAKSILDLNGEAITFQINCNETTNETNTTKTIAAARYTIQQLRGSNLFFLNFTYLIDSFENFTCNQSTIIITKTPVSLSEQDKCNRLKTTPYRERPQKCYFVNDNEPDGTCWSGSSRIIDRTKLSILLIQFCCLLYIFTAFAL